MVLALLAAVMPLVDDPAFPTMDSCFVIEAGDATGAGFMAPGEVVVTAAHVVDGSQTVRLTTGEVSPRRFTGRVVFTDPVNDLAVIKPNAETDVAPLRISSDTVSIGSVVYTVGSPIGRLVASRGVVVQVSPDAIVASAPVDHGNSGGPLVDVSGNVVGVVVQMSRSTGNLVAVPARLASEAIRTAATDTEDSKRSPASQPRTTTSALVAGIVTVALITTVVFALVLSLALKNRRRERRRIIITFEGN